MAHTYDSWVALYHMTPQEYFANRVKGLAAGEGIPGAEAKIAAWQKELAAIDQTVDPVTGSPKNLVQISNLQTSINEIEHQIVGLKYLQTQAQAFLDGKFADFGPYVSNQEAANIGLIDTTLVPA